uniref:Uncharacterized protein n=1 Tax=Cannabis sativa TaxID=3483 RepID=A0A803QHT9_CANSA
MSEYASNKSQHENTSTTKSYSTNPLAIHLPIQPMSPSSSSTSHTTNTPATAPSNAPHQQPHQQPQSSLHQSPHQSYPSHPMVTRSKAGIFKSQGSAYFTRIFLLQETQGQSSSNRDAKELGEKHIVDVHLLDIPIIGDNKREYNSNGGRLNNGTESIKEFHTGLLLKTLGHKARFSALMRAIGVEFLTENPLVINNMHMRQPSDKLRRPWNSSSVRIVVVGSSGWWRWWFGLRVSKEKGEGNRDLGEIGKEIQPGGRLSGQNGLCVSAHGGVAGLGER